MLAAMTATVAIVGRPNVGKSALFNRIAGRRIAIVHNQPGVTRDRVSAEVEWRGRPFTLIDTGGLGLLAGEKGGDPITRAAIAQVEVAVEAADVIIFVVNAQEGAVALDFEVAQRLRQSGRPVFLAVNKVDNAELESAVPEFAELGFEPLLPVSAIHGRGVAGLMKAVREALPEGAAAAEPAAESPEAEAVPAESAPLKLAVVGRPNVGKSSLVNALTQSDRVVVSPVPGTTRDAVDVPLEIATEGRVERYLLIDTAGMRKARRVRDSIEFYSVKRAEKSIERADLVVFVLDAQSGILEQDKKIADKIVAAHKACVVVINKWDLYDASVRAARRELGRQDPRAREGTAPLPTRMSEFVAWVKERLFFLDYAPVVFTSATEGMHLERLLEAVRFVADQLRQQVPTALLNRTLYEAIEERQPVSATGQRLRFFYATQVGQAPPRFLLFLNQPGPFAPQYVKYLTGRLRKAFGFEGCPILLRARARPKKVDFRKTGDSEKGRKRPAARRKKTARKRKSRP
jgi:GTP-binding protein